MFHDLDAALFNGQLRGRVILNWEAVNIYQNRKLGYTEHVLAAGDDPEHIKIALRYNMDWSCYPRHLMIGVLVHEMLHAYFMIYCGTCEEPLTLRDAGHGEYWMCAAFIIEQRTGLLLSAMRCVDPMDPQSLWECRKNWTFVKEFFGLEEGDSALGKCFRGRLREGMYTETEEKGIYMPPLEVYDPDHGAEIAAGPGTRAAGAVSEC
ncbi:hypothetical protein B0A48_07215 [Cryoendolithus antarcticus]|uniref:Uncharacterized protein n=1 Tax=Cryoendolithus antarcticus TaxID=1507870 RepID=A0A1V8T8G3_9PEZI|nr:hypothetical protein B0A48_07215 [Cryoendolithus antarcticus]